MIIRWKFVALIVVLALLFIALLNRKAATAAPQAPAAANTAAAKNAAKSASVSIPDTTLAVNSPTPMSQRVVHYEIDAKYDASKHTVDATEILTYHNLTGQPLDHFPFHLYQNAFQPNSTFTREAKVAGTRDVSYEEWKTKLY